MRKFKFTLQHPQGSPKVVFMEYPDDCSEEDIEEDFNTFVWENIDASMEEVK